MELAGDRNMIYEHIIQGEEYTEDVGGTGQCVEEARE